MRLQHDGYIVSWVGNPHAGYDSGSQWYADYDTAKHDTEYRRQIYGHGNVRMEDKYEIVPD
jgi:hypothetical protein